jgi:hypothetical protein
MTLTPQAARHVSDIYLYLNMLSPITVFVVTACNLMGYLTQKHNLQVMHHFRKIVVIACVCVCVYIYMSVYKCVYMCVCLCMHMYLNVFVTCSCYSFVVQPHKSSRPSNNPIYNLVQPH